MVKWNFAPYIVVGVAPSGRKARKRAPWSERREVARRLRQGERNAARRLAKWNADHPW